MRKTLLAFGPWGLGALGPWGIDLLIFQHLEREGALGVRTF